MKEENIQMSQLSLSQIKALTTTILDIETRKLHDELEELVATKEKIQRSIEKKSQEMQGAKYSVFNSLESLVDSNDTQTISKLHQVKLQNIDLFDLLSETVESAIITALEKSKDSEANETIEEIIRELTYQTIIEGTLNTIRVRKILSTILHSSIDIAEATPNKSEDILEATLRGMRAGLLHSIDRFKKRLIYMPLEAKHILIEDYDNIMEDLSQTDTLFLQVVQTQANESTPVTRKILLDLNKKMHYDLEELVHMSKEAAEVMKDRFSSFAKTAVKRADTAFHSDTAKEAKRMGTQAWGVAKSALESAIKSAKGVIDPKE
jgi:CRISPR/Cas system CSM-associated protein Csm2 small subunit